ncbi:hypothetical protein DUI87_11003 [Hirundo rustica rustica]|uniref:Uncharacterized protein n=1 Tax=Hirundo rustica rustica TaxID=333673 RepID=A0A3M0KFF2_HIRRU|nr:hypothetical protein DUI87_11003 [Hirundo rustica rustica]
MGWGLSSVEAPAQKVLHVTDTHVTKRGTQKFSGPWQREQQQMVLESFCEPLFVLGKCWTRTDTEFLGTLAEREKQQMVLGEFLLKMELLS